MCFVKYEKYSSLRGNVTPYGAFSSDDTLYLRVRVPRAVTASAVSLRIYRDDDMSESVINVPLIEFSDSDDVFEVSLPLGELCLNGEDGLFYYTFIIETSHGRLYTSRDGGLYSDEQQVEKVQLMVYKSDYSVPQKFRGSMMYQIFVDRFYDGGRSIPPDGKKVYNPDWQNGVPQYAEIPGQALANNEFFGGNLWGVAEKLDYISSLGVDTLYLCPIFESASNHKYDTGDYMKIDRMFGGEEAFDNLIAECKKRGMKLILDGVFNHTGDDSRYFNRYGSYNSVGAYQSEESPYFDLYTFEEFPEKYRCWWGIDILPAVDSNNPSWREFICGKDGVIRHYLRRGIDGWRLDVADELSDAFLYELRHAAREENPDAMIIGEVWEDASNKLAYGKRRHYFRGGQLDSVMNYPLKEAIIDYILGGDCTRLKKTARELWSHYPEAVSHALMNFLSTHDTERILSVLADVGVSSMPNRELASFRLDKDTRQKAVERLKLAWTLLAAFPGIPCIFYGDEAGMEGGRDPFNRMPYIWGNEDAELVGFYRRIGMIRKSEPLFWMGDLEIIETGYKSRFMLAREYDGRRLIAAVNLSSDEWSLEFEKSPVRLIEKRECGGVVSLAPFAAEYFVL
ncbi:MAG: glycoside hydrolase family 13 protein [Clostridia bacterium]|nr:glycoside hydrolase family 13 protein [Clostridia bacterium]